MAKAEDAPTIVDVGTLEILFGITDRRIQQLARAGKIPRAKRGLYPLIESVQAYIKFLQAAGADDDTVINIKRAEARIKNAKAEIAEGEAAVSAGRLIPVDVYESGLSEVLHAVRSALVGLPASAAPVVHELETIAEIQAALTIEVNEALDPIANAEIQAATNRSNKGRPRRNEGGN